MNPVSSSTPILATLGSLPHFGLLDPAVLRQVAAASRILELESGQVLFREADPCRAFYVVRSGMMKLYRATSDGRVQVVHHFGAGQTFAEAALFSFGRYPASAVAIQSPTELVEIGGEALLRLFDQEKRLASAMIGSLCMRLVSLVERVEELSLVDSGARLARYLMRQPGHGSAGGLRVELPMAKKALASHLSMTPETLSRLLRRWQDAGLVESEGASVAILDPQGLLGIADGEARGL